MNYSTLIFFSIVVGLLRVSLILFSGDPTDPRTSDTGDHFVYHLAAQMLSKDSSSWFKAGGELGYRAPGNFVYLSGVYSLFPNASFQIGQIATAVVGVLNCALMFFLVNNTGQNKSASLVFWTRGLLPCFIITDTFVLSEPLFATFLLGALVVLSLRPTAPTRIQSAVVGILIGCCMLTREAAVLYPVIFAGYLYVASRSESRATRAWRVTWFAVCFLLVLMPWMYRNAVVVGKILPLSYTAGVNLHIGNNAHATGKFVSPPEDDLPQSIKWGTPEYESWHRTKALAFIVEHPSQFLLLGVKKLAWFVWPRFIREDIRVVYQFPKHWALALSIISGVSSACLLLAGSIGFILRKPDWLWWITGALVSSAIVITFVVVGSPRYRDILDYLLIPNAAFLVCQWRSLWADLMSEESTIRPKLWMIVLVVSFFIGCWAWVGSMMMFS
mgnify:CR=1 FL=1